VAVSNLTAPPRSRPLPPRLRRVLSSPVLDALAVPHGISRYLELANPLWALDEDRAVVTAITQETDDVVTVTLRVRSDYQHLAGQYLRFGVEVDGRRRTRSYSISSSARRRDGHVTITVKGMPDGLVSGYVHDVLRPGHVVTISEPGGELTVTDAPDAPVLLVSGGSGITPVMSILRTLVDDGHDGPVAFLHYTRTLEGVPFRAELERIAASHPNVQVLLIPTEGRNPDGLAGHFDDDHLEALDVDHRAAITRACGPLALTDAVTERWEAAGLADNLRIEAFEARPIQADPDAATGTIRLTRSGMELDNDGRTLLDQAEAAGLTPESGCRMGICQSCVRVKHCGPVRDVRTGTVSSMDNEVVNLCVSVPLGDVDLDL
jgi:stearoyl-CoA 9-desaturase NADPH oxidoreductase